MRIEDETYDQLEAELDHERQENDRLRDEIERLRAALREMINLAQSMDGFGCCDEEEYETTIKIAREALGDE